MEKIKWSIYLLIVLVTLVLNCESSKAPKAKPLNYLAKGKEIALAARAELGSNLLKAIKEKGTAEALAFCNLKAIPLTNEVAKKQNAKIKRVSDKNRNPNNAANQKELEYIKKAKATLAKGEQAKPSMKEVNGKMLGYYPIVTDGNCLQCHGGADNIKEETLAMLNEKYPDDLATGYLVNQLRGIWVIELDK